MMRLAAVAFVLALAACGQAPNAGGESQSADATSAAAPAGPNKLIGPQGAGGVTTALPMDIAAIRAAAQHFVVAEVADQVEGDPFTAITLSAGNEEVFRISPTADRTKVHSIVTRSSQARGPAGEVIGQARFATAPVDQVAFCLTEYDEGAPGFACSTAQDGQFWRVYRLPEGAAAAASFEQIEPDLLHDALLVEMRWIAPRA
jgi:hypothetical protein